MPVSLVSFVDADWVFFKSRQGVPDSWGLDRPAPKSRSICSVVLNSTEPLVINNAREHEQVKDLAPVTKLGVAAYLGIPLITEDGHVLGSLCAIDTEPRVWTTGEVETLRDLAASVMAEVQLRAEIAERVQAEAEQAKLQATEAAANRRADRILASITDGFFALDRDWRFTYLNPQSESLLGRSRGDLLGKVLWDEFSESVGSRFDREYRHVIDSHQAVIFEDFYPPLKTWFEVHAYPSDDGVAVYFRNINQRREAEQTIRETQERFRVLLEGARDHALILMDRDGVILDWQGGAERILGWTKEEAIGQPGSIIFTPEDRANGIDQKEFARAAEVGVATAIRWHLRKDGSQFFADGVMTRLNDADGRVRGFAKVFQDATARKVAEDTLQTQAEALKQADVRKNEFLAMLAHELRNPLAAIRNALGVARSGQKADLDWGLEVIGRQMRGFTHLIDDLLDVSRITQGKIQLRKAVCDAAPIIRHAAEAVAPLIREKQHTLTLQLTDAVSAARSRRDPAGADPRQRPDQRREVHPAPRPDRPCGAGRGGRGRDPGQGQRRRDRRRPAPADVRAVRAGGPLACPIRGGARDRPDARPEPDRDARRHHHRRERGEEPGERVHDPLAGRPTRPACSRAAAGADHRASRRPPDARPGRR